MKGLEGKADSNKDKKITTGELLGDQNQIIVEYKSKNLSSLKPLRFKI